MPSRYAEIGHRLRAFRLASGLSADDVARQIGISRTALYRFEKGEVAKIETLERLADLLQVSLPALLGVGIEFVPSGVCYFERMLQLEAAAERMAVVAGPISFLLTSDSFEEHLEQLLRESLRDDVPHRQRALVDIDKLMPILHARREAYRRRRPGLVDLVSAAEIKQCLRNGFVGSAPLPAAISAQRRAIARSEIEHFASVIENEPIGVQIGIVIDTLPHTGFEIFRLSDRKILTTSPFRLGVQPNMHTGIGMITSAPEALAVYEAAVDEMWRTALKGAAAVDYLRALLSSEAAVEDAEASAPSVVAE